jgi:hypothetical protein
MLAGMAPPPHPMVEGTEAEDYYGDRITEATPAQLSYARSRAEATADPGRIPTPGKGRHAR